MTRRLIAPLLAAALALSGLSATPVRAADPDDIARFVGAATTLFILGKIIEDHRDGTARAHRPSPPQTHRPKTHTPQTHRPHAGGHHRPHARPPLPAQCLRDSPVAGTRYVMGVPCLRRNYSAMHRLPQACRVQAYVAGRMRHGYSVRCLRRSGFTIG